MILYAQNTKQRIFLAALFAKAMEVMQGTLNISRCFNTILNPAINSTTPARRPCHSVVPLIQKYYLYDVWQCFLCFEKDFIFLSVSHSSCSHIDLFCTTKKVVTRMNKRYSIEEGVPLSILYLLAILVTFAISTWVIYHH